MNLPTTHIDFNAEIVSLIRSNIAPTATDAEFALFINLCKEYQLNPLKKEIYFVKYGNKVSMYAGRDGYLTIANRHPQFDGIESDVVYDGDELTKRDNGSILIKYGPAHLASDRTKIIGAFCNVFRKDRSIAVSIFVNIKDYYKDGNQTWAQYKSAMIMKVAEANALKRAFEIGVPAKEVIEDKAIEDKSDDGVIE